MSIRLKEYETIFHKKHSWDNKVDIERRTIKCEGKEEARRTADVLAEIENWDLVEILEVK